jgi:hypothetical protein
MQPLQEIAWLRSGYPETAHRCCQQILKPVAVEPGHLPAAYDAELLV